MSTDTMGEISNQLIYNVLLEQVMPALAGIREEQVRHNGRLKHVENRSGAHTGRLGSLEDNCSDLSTRLGRLEGAGGAQAQQVQDIARRHEILDNRILNVAIEVAKWGAVALGILGGIKALSP